jgi:ribosomal protein S18 acetylase RimI-like enzyme
METEALNSAPQIRPAKPEDVPAIFRLIQELALFEKAPEEVENTPEQLLADGFGTNPAYGCWVAEWGNEVAGMALYYFRYSTWKGRRLYLEDIVVSEKHRGKGLGKALFEQMLRESLRAGCNGMVFQVLNWNEPAIHFYKKYGVKLDEEWTNASLSRQEIEKLMQKAQD